MPNTVLDYVRSKEPRFADVPDDELTSFIAEKHPEFLQVPEFKADVDSLGTKGFESEEVVSSETSRAEKRAALAKEMSAERLRGMGAKALENLVGSVEATAKSITNPIEFIKQTERGVEAAATLITGEPKVLTVKPSEVMQRPLAKIPDLVPSDLLDSNLKASVEGAAEMLGLGKPDLTTVAKMGAGVANAVIGFANFMQTPEGVALLGTGKLPEAARRSVSVAIAAQMAVHAPESFNAAVEAARAGDVQTAAQRATEFIGGTAIAAKAADHGFTGPQVMVNRLRAADAPATAEAVKEATGTKEPPPTPPSTGPKPLPDEFRVTVMPEQKLPGYVQIDQPPPPTPTPGVDIVSGRPEQVAQKGYEVPDLSKLPPGRYTVGELREKGLLNPPEPAKPVETKAPVPETKPVEPVTEPPKVETPKVEEAPPNATPMQKRYFDLKRNLAPDEILAIRMGDFYEVFGQDAATVAKMAGVALTKRGNVQMAGVPFHAANRFAEKIAEGGKKLVFDEGERAKPVEEAPKAAPVEAKDIESMLTAEIPNVEEARARVKVADRAQAELRERAKVLERESKEIEKIIKPQRGSAYTRSKIKATAPKAQVARYNELQKEWRQIGNELHAIDESVRKDRQAVDAEADAKVISDKSQPLLRRLDRQARRLEPKVPKALQQALDAELKKVILEKYPDATAEEIARLGPEVRAMVYHNPDPFKALGAPKLEDIRRTALDAAVKPFAEHMFSDELKADLARYRRTGRTYGGPVEPGTPELPLSAAKLAELKERIKSDTDAWRKRNEEQIAKEKAEEDARKAEEAKLIAEAQEIVDRAKRVGTVGGRTAKAIKEELIDRVEEKMGALVEKSGVTLKNMGEEGGVTHYTASSESGAAFGEISRQGNKYRVNVRPINDAKANVSRTVDTLEHAELLIKTMASVGKGRVIIAVPGDGIFRINNDGPALIKVWNEAHRLITSSGASDAISRGGPAEKPPSGIKTEADWNAAKEYHGLEALDKISGWSPALAELAKKIDPDAPEKVTAHDVDSFIKRKKEAPKAPEPEPVKAHEERIGRKGKQADPFQMDEGDLADLFEERFGTKEPPQPGQFGRQGKFTFPTYDEFKKWMDARYAERDLEGMKMAFAEADTPTKVRYVKDNRASDPALKAWIAHIATGAELPKDNPAVPRTTPRPMPGGGTQPVQGPPSPPRQGQPPPPPRQPTSHRKFDIMALTQLFRQFGNSPVVNKRLQSAYGRMVPDKEAVELKERLLWDTALAERVLGHEIGHYIDLIVPLIGKGRQLANRLRPLWDFRGEMWRKQELRQEARALSREWRGPFTNGDRYRDSAAELFADFMSAMFNKPEWVNQNYPKLFDSFQHLRDGKPQFASAYREIETWLQGDTMAREWIDQQKGAAKRTIDDLMEETKKPKRSFMDTLKGNFVSIWHRAFEKEGKPRELGSSLTDELEYSNSWAAKENAIFKDDFQKTVEPELKKVHADPLEARSLLHAYSQARRTIGERRAAGVWIEQNPVEARTMLERLLEVNDELRSKFGNQLASAPDSALYDLSAAIFREIHDRGERFVDRMAKEINELDLGVSGDAALQAFNVRGKLLNPGGLTPENAVKVLDTLKDRLTADQWRALEKAGSALRDLIYDTQEKAYNEGLISKKTWEELIEPNRDNYVPYAVLDHWEGKVRGGVMPQKGTAKDIADVTLAAQLKIGALNAWRQKQRQVQLLRDTYAKGGQPIPVGEALKKSAQIDDIRKKNAKDDVSRAVLWQDGKPHLVEFPGDPGKTLEMAMDSSAFYEHMDWIHSLSGLTHQLMQLYTTLSVPFLVYRNPIRGARTGALRTGFRAIGKQYLSPEEMKKASAMAKNYADAAFGGEMSPEIRQLVDQQVLLPPRLSATMVRDAANLKELLETGGVLATEVKQLHGEKWPWWKGGKPGKAAFEVAEKVFTGYEAFEKIQNYLAAKARGATEEQATAIGRRAGIPKPGVGGHLSLATEVMLPWARVHIQGIRSTLDFLRDPTYRKGFVTRFAMTEALPRILKVGIASGVIAGGVKWLLSDDEDKNDTVMAEVFRRVSPYKMALDDVVPLMLFDPRTGSYHYFNDFKSGSEIPKHYEVVSFRIPSSEEGRLWGTLLYNTLSSIPGAKEKVARPGTDLMSNVGDWAKNNLSVGISPAIETSGNLYQMIALGRNPEDSFRGQPAANQRLFDAGGVERAQAIAGYTLNQLGGPGEIAAVMAMNAGILDKRATDALKKRIASDKTPLPERLPLAKNMFSYDNYASFREQKQADIADQQLRAKARLVMSENVQALYDFYYKNVKHHDKLQGGDQIRYRIASAFVSQIWGDLKNPNSFYARAAHAVGPDGSKMARETVRRDLDQALSGAMIEFQRAGQ